MARREIKSEGKDVASAIIHGLNELGRRRDQVEVTVVQEEKSGFLGIGGRPAIVHIIEKKWDAENSTPMKPKATKAAAPASFKGKENKERGGRKRRDDSRKQNRKARPERSSAPRAPKENEAQKLPSMEIQSAVIPDNVKEPMNQAKESLSKILGYMGIKVDNLNVWWDGKQQRILLTFDCDHPAVVIGKEGKTLESIQYIITLIVSRHFDNPISVMADTQNYWRKLEDKINNEIEKAVNMLKRTKRTYRFRPMPAQMRRYIHRFLVDNPEVSTVSEGEGKWRKVILKLEAKDSANGEAVAASAAAAAFEEVPSCADDCCNCGPAVEGEVSAAAVEPCAEQAAPAEEAAKAETDCVANSCGCASDTEGSCCCSGSHECSCKEEAPAEAVKAEEACVVSADNAKCACVLTAESTACACVATTEGTCAQPVEAPKAEEQNAQPEACVVSVENTQCDCVVSGESTNCGCTATTEGTCADNTQENK